MPKVIYCKNCTRNVNAKKEINWVIFLMPVLLDFLFSIRIFTALSILYSAYHLLREGDICEICNCSDTEGQRFIK